MFLSKLKLASIKHDVPLNSTAIIIIEDLHREAYFGEDTPLICNDHGGYTMPEYFRSVTIAYLKRRGLRNEVYIRSDTLLRQIL